VGDAAVVARLVQSWDRFLLEHDDPKAEPAEQRFPRDDEPDDPGADDDEIRRRVVRSRSGTR
jgi:hypothetical protein